MTDPRVRALSERLDRFERAFGLREVHTDHLVMLDEGGTGMSEGMDAYEDAITARAERNRGWGRDGSRDEALAQLVNEGEIPMWEERPPVQQRSRQGAVEVRDDF